MKYKYILVIYHNWNKTCGWSRWAARLTSAETGKQWTGMIPHSSNLEQAIVGAGIKMENVYYMTISNMILRDFRLGTQNFGAESCTKSLIESIKQTLDLQ